MYLCKVAGGQFGLSREITHDSSSTCTHAARRGDISYLQFREAGRARAWQGHPRAETAEDRTRVRFWLAAIQRCTQERWRQHCDEPKRAWRGCSGHLRWGGASTCRRGSHAAATPDVTCARSNIRLHLHSQQRVRPPVSSALLSPSLHQAVLIDPTLYDTLPLPLPLSSAVYIHTWPTAGVRLRCDRTRRSHSTTRSNRWTTALCTPSSTLAASRSSPAQGTASAVPPRSSLPGASPRAIVRDRRGRVHAAAADSSTGAD